MAQFRPVASIYDNQGESFETCLFCTVEYNHLMTVHEEVPFACGLILHASAVYHSRASQSQSLTLWGLKVGLDIFIIWPSQMTWKWVERLLE